MKIAYLINTYPRTSHSFIRREIAGLEAAGVTVDRYSVRRPDTPLVDEADQREQTLTTTILDAGAAGLLWATLATALTRPGRLFTALGTARRLGRRSETGVLLHLIYLAEAR